MTGATAVRVRRATAADVDRVVPLFEAYRRFYGAASDPTAARRFLATRLEREESVVLLAVAAPPDDDVLGMAQLYRSFSSVALRETTILNDLFVVPQARGLGVGRRLVDAVAAHAREIGAVRLELSTQHANRVALGLYRATGFVEDAEFAHLTLSLASGPAPAPGDAPC